MNIKISVLNISLLLLGGASTARAAYEDVGVSARISGMGGVYTAVADDVYSVYYNPAGLGTLDRASAGVSYARLQGGLSDNSAIQNTFLGYAHPLSQGRQGALGTAWNYFSVDDLYREMSLYASYGRLLWGRDNPSQLYGGVTLKALTRSLGSVGSASAPINETGQVVAGRTDAALSRTSRWNLDADVGFLYRIRPRWTVGLLAAHVNQPNVGFSMADRLHRNYRLGGAYKTAFTTLALDGDFKTAPDGSTDKAVTVAAEKWLPTLLHGTFGFRGGIGVGTRDYRQLTAGLSYKINKMQFDYGFALPVGGLSKSFGTHRVGMTFAFGRPRHAEPVISEAILENMGELAEVGTLEFRYQIEGLALYTRRAIDELLRQAKVEAGAGRFAEASGRVVQAQSLKPNDPKIRESADRLRAAAAVYPELQGYTTDAAQAALYESVLEFLSGDDHGALRKLAYAQTFDPGDARMKSFKTSVEHFAGVIPAMPPPAPAVPPVVAISTPAAPAPAPVVEITTPTVPVVVEVASAPAAAPAVVVSTPAVPVETAAHAAAVPVAVPAPAPRPRPIPTDPAQIVAQDTVLMETALRTEDYYKAVKLGEEIVRYDPANVLAYKRLGTAYGALRNFGDALKALRNAYRLEKEPEAKKKLRFYIDALVPLLEKQTREAAGEEAKPVARTPEEVARLYEAGVELYSQGKLAQAAELFRRALEIDPKNASAKKALERVKAEMMSGRR